MSAAEIDAYLAALAPAPRATLEQLRADILHVVPDAEQGMSYSAPAFRVGGKVVAGFSAGAKHLSYLPHSGTVLGALAAELEGRSWSKGALKFAIGEPLPRELVAKLVAARRAEIG